MAKKNAATAKKPSLKERMAANEQSTVQGGASAEDLVDDAGDENEGDPAGPQEGDETDPALNAPIEGAEDEDSEDDDAAGAPSGQPDKEEDQFEDGEGFTIAAARKAGYSEEAVQGMCAEYGVEYVAPVDDQGGENEAPDPVDANVAIGASLFSDPSVKRTADMKFDEAGQWIPGPDDEPSNEDPFDGMDELQVAKLTALKETFGAKGFRVGEFKKNRPQVFHMVNEDGNDFASGTLEDLAFLALTFEKKAPDDEAPAPRRDHHPDPILKSKKRHPINSFHDMSIVLKDDGRFMKFDRVGDFYEIHIFDQADPATAICKGTVPLNATKEDLTRFYWKSKKIK